MPSLEAVGEHYSAHRQSIVQARQEGLTQTYIRDELTDMVVRDLLGPAGGSDEELNQYEDHAYQRYLVGMLAPKDKEVDGGELDELATRGLYFYLYLFMDIFSRKIVGWQIYETESSELAAEVMRDICERENIAPGQVVLHSDNGSPMKGATMLATLQALGVMPSFSRPAVSNDNPYSESLFKTMKYRPIYPRRAFESLQAARLWVSQFVQWYNHEHRHSAIRFVTPGERHAGLDVALLSKRVEVYEAAKARHPERWSGATRNWQPIKAVYLNPDQHVGKKRNRKEQPVELKKAA